MEGGGARCHDVDGNLVTFEAVPSAFQARSPVVKQGGLIEQEDGASGRGRDVLGPREGALPEPRKRRLWRIGCGVDGHFSGAPGDLEKQRCLPDLAGPTEKLDAARCGLSEPPAEQLAALDESASKLGCSHSRIIIRL